MDDFPPIEWEMRSINTSSLDSQGKAYISFRPSRDFKDKNIGNIRYYEEYPHHDRVLDAHRLVYINGKSPSGRGKGVIRQSSLEIFPDNPLETGDVITFYRDWFVMSVSEGGGFSFGKTDWYKVRIVTESITVP
jgi:hypothetical protein